jgi:outer membrane protein insertion porin family
MGVNAATHTDDVPGAVAARRARARKRTGRPAPIGLGPTGAAAALTACLVLATSTCGPAVAGQVIRSEVVGHESVSTRDVLAILGVAERSVFDEGVVESGADSLLALLAGLGRPFARVGAEWDSTAGGVEITVVVDEGPEILLGELEFAGSEGPITDELRRDLELRPGRGLTPGALAGDTDALLDAYANEGRPFAEVALPSFVELSGEGVLAGRIEVSEGLETTVGDVVVAGNEVTRDRVIVRESGLELGALYSEKRLAEVRPRLERLDFLDAVEEPVVAVDPLSGEATVGIAVEEGASNRISGAVGFSGGPGTADELTGLVDIELVNIAGTGRSASAAWERIRVGETEISFSYTEPWLLGAPIDVGVAGAQSIRDTLYTTTEGDLLVTARMGGRTRLTWSLGAERYVPGAATESTTTSTRTAFAAAYDGTDAPWNPTSGSRLVASLEYAAKEIADSGRRERSGTVTAEAQLFARVRARQVLALRARGAALASTEDEVPFHELLTIGGALSLRGYREEQFRGNRVALGSVEYRLLLGRRSRALAFIDLGYWHREGSNSAKDTNLGYGIGLRGDTRLGTISIDYGLGEGDDLLDGKLHAGLIREF